MDNLIKALAELDEDLVCGIVGELHSSGLSNIEIIHILNSGMLEVGARFETGEYYLADLIMSGIIYRKALEVLGLDQEVQADKIAKKVLIGVVKNDIHDIGKDIVASTLISNGFEVLDLGVDVSADKFVAYAIEHRPDIIALSGSMSFAAKEMKHTIDLLNKAQVREYAKIIVGGFGIDLKQSRELGADGYSNDAIEALSILRRLVNE